jgi:hypothetical protein
MRIEFWLSGAGALCLALLPSACSTAEPGSLPSPAQAPQDPPSRLVSDRDTETSDPAEAVPSPTPSTPIGVGATDAQIDNSQTGSPGSYECVADADCDFASSTGDGSAVSVQLVGARCQFLDGVYDQHPYCECKLLRTPRPGEEAIPEQERVFTAWPGNRPGSCSEYTTTPGCLYCERDFPGCNIDDAASCDAVCADFAARQNRDFARSVVLSKRLARCSEAHTCERLYELDGACYVGAPGRIEARAYDCSLSDAELLAQSPIASTPSCTPRPDVSCQSASDCPGGLACKDGVCGPCVQECQITGSDDASCRGGGACAAGETCAAGVCTLDAAVTCRDFIDCGTDHQCVVSGVDWSAGRGNAHTRTFCR